MPTSLLTGLQREVLEAFFRRENRFFLSGGAALAGFHVGHRQTHDLDLFTTMDILEGGEGALRQAALDLGATVESIQTAPDFRRRIVRRDPEAVVVDLVRDRAPQGPLPKQRFGDIVVDPPQEILANKLCALLSRSELRDLVDVQALERAGFAIEEALELAGKKDAGFTAGQLGYVLSQIDLGDSSEHRALADYAKALSKRLAVLAAPPI
ncbi:MAG TPA: nucleotidyl transferase AbiEii/AbiGii toxin family protein [Myxococcales bacterium]|nr:nucleotidyl transferase AbiEii/AbiGii toxin family protein [Myxococcales bacterium]